MTAFPGLTAGTWTVDPTHAEVGFVARHIMVAKVRGRFTEVSGTVEVGETLAETSVRAVASAASVSTNQADRDGHLRSADFFDAASHPTMEYHTTAVRRSGDGFEVDGDLTIKGVTRPVTLAVEFNGIGSDPWGGKRLGLSARGEINRGDFGISFNVPLEGGGVMVGERVQLIIEVEAVLQA